MRPVLTVAEMRSVDEEAQRHVPISTLIERAGTAVATKAISMLGGAYGRRIVVVAGRGNNGNDGRVAASILARRGALVSVVDAAGPQPRAIGAADLVIDAAYGTGFQGDYEAPVVPRRALVLAVDVPSGLDADLGLASDGAVRADATVTFGALKPGLLIGSGPDLAGDAVVREIGLPIERASCRLHLVDDSDLDAVPGRGRDDHKWVSAVMVVAGSPGMYGSALFVSRGAARTGAGMVRLGIPGADLCLVGGGEAVAFTLPTEDFDETVLRELARCKALVIGPGLGLNPETAEAVRRIISNAKVPTVVDADALSALGDTESAAAIIGRRGDSGPVVLTPHDREFARLAGRQPGEDRIGAARELASSCGAVVLLKGPTTVVACPSGDCLLSNSGSPALATAGSGDVLAGVIGALLARGLDGAYAAGIAAHLHGAAALAGRCEGLIAGDLPELVSAVLSQTGTHIPRAAREPARG